MSSDVETYLADLHQTDPDKHAIMHALHQLVRSTHPDIEQGVKYGGVMYSVDGTDCGGIFASKNHVSFEFSRGNAMSDPKGTLEGSGKLRRHIKVKTIDDIETKDVGYFIEQMGAPGSA